MPSKKLSRKARKVVAAYVKAPPTPVEDYVDMREVGCINPSQEEVTPPEVVPPSQRKTGWRWHNPTFTYGILAIEGTHYFVRKSGRPDLWLVTKIEAQEITYYTVLRDNSCTCKSREQDGCKHVKALLALKAANQL